MSAIESTIIIQKSEDVRVRSVEPSRTVAQNWLTTRDSLVERSHNAASDMLREIGDECDDLPFQPHVVVRELWARRRSSERDAMALLCNADDGWSETAFQTILKKIECYLDTMVVTARGAALCESDLWRRDLDRYVTADVGFHASIVAFGTVGPTDDYDYVLLKNVPQMLASFHSRTDVVRATLEHVEIYEALAERNGRRAIKALGSHLRKTKSRWGRDSWKRWFAKETDMLAALVDEMQRRLKVNNGTSIVIHPDHYYDGD